MIEVLIETGMGMEAVGMAMRIGSRDGNRYRDKDDDGEVIDGDGDVDGDGYGYGDAEGDRHGD
jgi:hypothetical protein